MNDTARTVRIEKLKDGAVLCDGEQSYPLSKLGAEDYPACRDKFAQRLRQPVVAALAEIEALKKLDLPPAQLDMARRELMDRAYADIKLASKDRAPDPKQVAAWADNTEEGAAYTLYLMLRKATPSITEEQAAELFKRLDFADFTRDRDEMLTPELQQAAAAKAVG